MPQQSLPVVQFSITMDGTQDIQGKEQVSVCLKYMENDIIPQEVFVGLHEMPGTTVAMVALDVVLRLHLPISGL